MRAEADEIDVVLFRVAQNFAVWLAFSNSVLDVAPQVGFGRHGFLQTMRSLVIIPFPAQRVPGNFRRINSERRQDVKEVQV